MKDRVLLNNFMFDFIRIDITSANGSGHTISIGSVFSLFFFYYSFRITSASCLSGKQEKRKKNNTSTAARSLTQAMCAHIFYYIQSI